MATSVQPSVSSSATSTKVTHIILQPKWPANPGKLSAADAQAKRRDEVRYLENGFAVPHANARQGIPGEKFLRMYNERYSEDSYRMLTNSDYAQDRLALTQMLKDGKHVLPNEEMTSDGQTGDELNLHPKSSARKHLSEFTSESFKRIHTSLLNLSERNVDPKIKRVRFEVDLEENPKSTLPKGVCFDLDRNGRLVGFKLPQYITQNPSFDSQASLIASFCYVSFQDEPIAHTHGPRQTDDKFMCLDGEQWKWCYTPSGEGTPSKYLVGSYRYLKEPISDEVEFAPVTMATLGNLYSTSMDAFQSVQIGIFLTQYMGILEKGGKRNLDIQREFFQGLKEMTQIKVDGSMPPIEYYDYLEKRFGALLNQAFMSGLLL